MHYGLELHIGEFHLFNFLKNLYFSSYLPGAIIRLRILKKELGTIFIKKVIIFHVLVGMQIAFPINIASTASFAILLAGFFKNSGTLSVSGNLSAVGDCVRFGKFVRSVPPGIVCVWGVGRQRLLQGYVMQHQGICTVLCCIQLYTALCCAE